MKNNRVQGFAITNTTFIVGLSQLSRNLKNNGDREKQRRRDTDIDSNRDSQIVKQRHRQRQREIGAQADIW